MSTIAFPVLEKHVVFNDSSDGKIYVRIDSKTAKDSNSSKQAMIDGKLVWVEPFVLKRETVPAAAL